MIEMIRRRFMAASQAKPYDSRVEWFYTIHGIYTQLPIRVDLAAYDKLQLRYADWTNSTIFQYPFVNGGYNHLNLGPTTSTSFSIVWQGGPNSKNYVLTFTDGYVQGSSSSASNISGTFTRGSWNINQNLRVFGKATRIDYSYRGTVVTHRFIPVRIGQVGTFYDTINKSIVIPMSFNPNDFVLGSDIPD